eukprot:3490393-Alexandrium_andersonii.AAC.1
MSASLVGSEMCIRDSNDAMLSEMAECPGVRPDRDPQRRPPLAEAHRASPVSYTHLTLPTICSV